MEVQQALARLRATQGSASIWGMAHSLTWAVQRQGMAIERSKVVGSAQDWNMVLVLMMLWQGMEGRLGLKAVVGGMTHLNSSGPSSVGAHGL